MNILIEQLKPIYTEDKTLAGISYLMTGYEVKFVVASPTLMVNHMTLKGEIIIEGTTIDASRIETTVRELLKKFMNDSD